MRSLRSATFGAVVLASVITSAASAQGGPPFLEKLDGTTAAELGQSLADRVGAAHPRGSEAKALVDDLVRQGFAPKANLFHPNLPKQAVAPTGWGETAGRVQFYADRSFEAGRCLWVARVFWNNAGGKVDALTASVEERVCG